MTVVILRFDLRVDDATLETWNARLFDVDAVVERVRSTLVDATVWVDVDDVAQAEAEALARTLPVVGAEATVDRVVLSDAEYDRRLNVDAGRQIVPDPILGRWWGLGL